jgi:N12 class adenine-specific DNA methylase
MLTQNLNSSYNPVQDLLFYFSNKSNEYVFKGTETRIENKQILKNYDLRNRSAVLLSKRERKQINNEAKYIINKQIDDITEDEKNILRQYTGDGGLNNKSFGYLNQHYTDYDTVKAVFNAIDNTGFKYIKSLEPAAGSGNFVGFRPNAEWTTVEVCNINNSILNILYPEANHYNLSFENFNKKDFDLVISNVPFAESRGLASVHSRPDIKALHDYYFIKAMELVKERGLIVFITSTYTMDGRSKTNLRKEIINKCDLLSAYRLPNNHFVGAHTNVQADLIILQKRPAGLLSTKNINNDLFVNVGEYQKNVYLNNYYLENQQNILGRIEIKNDRFGKESIYIEGIANLNNISFDLNFESPTSEIVKNEKSNIIPTDLKEFEKWEADNKNYLVKKSISLSCEDGSSYLSTDNNFFDDFFIIDNDNENVIFYQLSKEIKFTDVYGSAKLYVTVEGSIKEKLSVLYSLLQLSKKFQNSLSNYYTNKANDIVVNYKINFVKHPSSDLGLKKFLNKHNAESFYYDVSTLFNEDYSLSDVFVKRVKHLNSGIKKADINSSLTERALASENNKGIIDVHNSCLIKESEIIESLKSGYAIIDIINGSYIIQNNILYYSGNIYKKIKKVTNLKSFVSSEFIPYIEKQITKLKSVLPEPRQLEDINFKGCENWIRPIIKSFLHISKKESLRNGQSEWFLKDYNFDILGDWYNKELFEKYLNDKSLVKREEKEAAVLYLQRLAEKEESIIDIKERLKLAIQRDSKLLEQVEYSYNKKFRGYVKPDYSKATYLIRDVIDEVEFNNPVNPKTGAKIRFRDNQLQWICQAYYEGRGINANDVGGGKTFAAIALARLLKIKGIVNKPIFTVPAKTIKNWEREIKILFPEAKIINLGNLQKNKRTKLLMETAKTNADYILISHEGFRDLELNTENELKYFNYVVREHIDNEKASARAKLLLDQKINDYREIISNRKRDEFLTLENLGIDAIFADEAHNFKNIAVRSKLVNAGLGIAFNLNQRINIENDTVSVALKSARSYDFRFKTNYIADRNNGKNIFLLTATPTPNKPMEVYTMLRHLDRKILNEFGIYTDMDFKNSFFEIGMVRDVKDSEKMKTILKKIVNAQSLNSLINRYIDKRSIEDLNIPVPMNKLCNNYLNKSYQYTMIEEDLRERADEISGDNQKGEDTHIAIYTGGRNGSVDPRLYGGSFANVNIDTRTFNKEDDKIEAAIIDTVDVYNKNPNCGQLLFLDTVGYTQVENGSMDKDIHQEIKDELLKRTNLTSKEVVIITGKVITNPKTGNDSKTPSGEKKDILKQTISDLYNDGIIKILLGTSSSMGEGCNLQTKSLVVRHLDIPYTNGIIKQRNGRAVRFGNENETVYIHYYFMKGSFDKISYDLVSKKKGWNTALWAKDIEDEISTVEEMRGGVIPSSEQIQIELEADPIKKEIMILNYKYKTLMEEKNCVYQNFSRIRTKIERRYEFLECLKIQKIERTEKLKSIMPDNTIKNEEKRLEAYNKRLAHYNKLVDNAANTIDNTGRQIVKLKEKCISIEREYIKCKNSLEEFNRKYINDETGKIEIDNTINLAA